MEYAVSRDGTSLVTLHEGSDTTARNEAVEQLTDRLEEFENGPVADWAILDSDVSEPPTGPFDPYTIAVDFTVTVVVDAEDAESAKAVGTTTIEAALETAGIDYVSYSTDPAVSGP